MKLLTKRAYGLLILALLLIAGLLTFTVRYVLDSSDWAMHAMNKHLYTDGILKTAGKIYDKDDEILLQTIDGTQKYNESRTVRKALMPVIGDSYGNIATSLQVAYSDRLSGWDLLNGAYRFNDSPGNLQSDIHLTLSAELCKTAYNAMNGRKGTVGVYNYKSGEILCMVSLPTFDPENHPDVAADPERYEGVYINRLLSGVYTPGSVFKLVTAAAAIDKLEGIDTMTFECEGKRVIEGIEVTCPEAHGTVDLKGALARSCNLSFAEISLKLGGDTLQEYAEKAGFNSSLKVDGIRTATGRADMRDAAGGDLAWAGIGQYSDMANPLNFMAYAGAIGNAGVRVTPSMINDTGLRQILWGSSGGNKRILSPETAAKLKEMMRNDVLEEYGERSYQGLELCAKSGTAQVSDDEEPHSWFVGFLDREDCPLAFVVVVENGGSGSKAAGAVAAKVLKEAARELTAEGE